MKSEGSANFLWETLPPRDHGVVVEGPKSWLKADFLAQGCGRALEREGLPKKIAQEAREDP